VRRFLLLVNPTARGGRAPATLAEGRAVLEAAGAELRVEETQSLEHAAQAAAAAAASGETPVAVGGDGLVGTMAGALRDAAQPLGILPAGRGNDFARFLGLPLQARGAAQVLLDGSVRAVDVGEANGLPFVGIVSVGIDSVVNEKANAAKLIRGEAVYIVTALRVIATWRHATFTVAADGHQREVRGYSVGVANSGAYGGGMIVVPRAQLDDGKLDVFTFAADSKLRFLRQLPQRAQSGHVGNPTFAVEQAAAVAVDADRPFPVYADGEPIGQLPVEVTLRRRCLRVLAPAPE
jgi:YegS/Rv2252/BmrU family lipid kinase